jgi:hypothetical protein
MKSEKNLMLNIEWADQYTNYLRGEPTEMKIIKNQELQVKFANDPEKLIEDIDYVTYFNLISKLFKNPLTVTNFYKLSLFTKGNLFLTENPKYLFQSQLL